MPAPSRSAGGASRLVCSAMNCITLLVLTGLVVLVTALGLYIDRVGNSAFGTSAPSLSGSSVVSNPSIVNYSDTLEHSPGSAIANQRQADEIGKDIDGGRRPGRESKQFSLGNADEEKSNILSGAPRGEEQKLGQRQGRGEKWWPNLQRTADADAADSSVDDVVAKEEEEKEEKEVN